MVAGRVSVSGPNSLLGMIFVPMISGLQAPYPDIEQELQADIPCILRQQEPNKWSFQSTTGARQTVTPKLGLRVNTMELAHAAPRADQSALQAHFSIG